MKTLRSSALGAPLRFEDVLDSQGNVTDSRLVGEEAKPFGLDDEFTFDLRDGKLVVDSRQSVRNATK